MRILVADQNALLLAAIAATFGRHCEIVTATRRDQCLEHLEKQHFDLIVACDKLADYTGLELLSEVTELSPDTLRILAAPPARLKRLGAKLDLFGLLGTLTYPIDPRKLVVAFKVARSKLPAPPPPKKVHHVVLESEWDTGERLGILQQELEGAPPPPGFEAAAAIAAFEATFDENPNRIVDEAAEAIEAASAEPPVEAVSHEFPAVADAAAADDVAANDPVFVDEPAPARQPPPQKTESARSAAVPSRTPASTATSAPGASAAPALKSTARPKAKATASPAPRKPTTPTPAQREAFQRALARRNAERLGGGDAALAPAGPAGFKGSRKWKVESGPKARTDPSRYPSGPEPSAADPGKPSQSLAELARMSTTKRPLPGSRPNGTHQKRAVFAVGSGLAAVILVAIVSFGVLRANPPASTGRHQQAATAPLFGSTSNLAVAHGENSAPQTATPAPDEGSAPAPEIYQPGPPQPQTFDPNTAPPDPPPPPALEHPGPMEPPSMAHNGPPVGMQGGSTDD